MLFICTLALTLGTFAKIKDYLRLFICFGGIWVQ